MKRKVAGVLAAAMAAGMLAGCGSSAKPADTTAAKAEDTKAAEGSTEAAAADNGDKNPDVLLLQRSCPGTR